MWPQIKLSETLIIPSYFVSLSLLYSGLIIYTVRRALKRDRPVETVLQISLILMIVGFIGARLFHVFYEVPSFYKGHWERVLMFWYGGFVYFGGALAAFASALIFLRIKKEQIWPWLDFFAPVISVGYGLGRISCFISGCCYGQICDLPWSVSGRHPTQLYAAFWELSVFAGLIWLERRPQKLKTNLSIFLIWLSLHSLGRLLMEFYRDDFRGALWLGLSISSWISLILLSLSLGLMLTRPWMKPAHKAQT